jgi:2-polyprenyl-3-methyl-5-hydroxy-6-metoxy-1,4-benzoquinol methylase
MNEFDIKASEWDSNPMHWERSATIVKHLIGQIAINNNMTALEFGAGTGITSFFLKDKLREITMMDSSPEMVRIMNEKINVSGSENLKALLFDLEKDEMTEIKYDLIITQMVLHHVIDIKNIIRKFNKLLNNGGYVAIADLYPEDGSFHGKGFAGHKGFNPLILSAQLREVGFENTSFRKCFVINKETADSGKRQFDVFLLIAKKS